MSHWSVTVDSIPVDYFTSAPAAVVHDVVASFDQKAAKFLFSFAISRDNICLHVEIQEFTPIQIVEDLFGRKGDRVRREDKRVSVCGCARTRASGRVCVKNYLHTYVVRSSNCLYVSLHIQKFVC